MIRFYLNWLKIGREIRSLQREVRELERLANLLAYLEAGHATPIGDEVEEWLAAQTPVNPENDGDGA